jgi:hypothetical protein
MSKTTHGATESGALNDCFRSAKLDHIARFAIRYQRSMDVRACGCSSQKIRIALWLTTCIQGQCHGPIMGPLCQRTPDERHSDGRLAVRRDSGKPRFPGSRMSFPGISCVSQAHVSGPVRRGAESGSSLLEHFRQISSLAKDIVGSCLRKAPSSGHFSMSPTVAAVGPFSAREDPSYYAAAGVASRAGVSR